MNVTGSALFEEWSPVLVVIANLSVQQEVNKLREARIFVAGSCDLLFPVVHHHPPPVLVVVVLVELSPLHGRVLQLIPEGAEDSLKRMPHEYDSFPLDGELWISIPARQVAKLLPGEGVSLAIQHLH